MCLLFQEFLFTTIVNILFLLMGLWLLKFKIDMAYMTDLFTKLNGNQFTEFSWIWYKQNLLFLHFWKNSLCRNTILITTSSAKFPACRICTKIVKSSLMTYLFTVNILNICILRVSCHWKFLNESWIIF